MRSKAIKNINYLKLLTDYSKSSPSQFKVLLNNSNSNELKAITEIIFNLLQGHLKCKGIKKFKKHKSILRNIADRNCSKKKKILLIKKGRGFLFPLLAAAIPAILQMFTKKK